MDGQELSRSNRRWEKVDDDRGRERTHRSLSLGLLHGMTRIGCSIR